MKNAGQKAKSGMMVLGIFLAGVMAGCATNPVTGEQELTLVSESQEIEIGRQYYGPTQQTQGGPYATLPALTDYVNEVGQKLVAVSDRPDLPYEFSVLNNPTPNAWALPGGKLAINRGLLMMLENEAELAAVLAHEIVHAAARHSAQQMERQTLGSIVTTAAMIGVASAVDDSQSRDLIMGAAHTTAALGSQLVHAKYGRDAEKEADLYGMRYMAEAGYDPRAAVTLQEKFLELSEGKNPNWLEGLFASHPPSQERVEANRETLEALPEGGELGADEYQARIESLRQAEPAYARYREAVETYQSGNLDRSLEQVNEASAMLPREGLFDALKSRIYSRQEKPDQAMRSIQSAISKNPNYFAFHLMEGQLYDDLGNKPAAQSAFMKSNQLLPTAESQAALGFLALSEGREDVAYQYLSQAAQYDQTRAGQAAYKAWLPMEMRRNPGRFIEAGAMIDKDGSLIVRVTNRSPVAYQAIVLEVVTADRKREELVISQGIHNGQTVVLKTGLGPYNSDMDPGALARVQLVRALVK